MAKKSKETNFAPAEISTAAKSTTYIIKDNYLNVEVEMNGEEWAKKRNIFISAKDYQQAKENAPEGENLPFKAGFRRYEFVAYKEIGTDARLTFQDARIAFKNNTHRPPAKCSTC